MGAKTHQPKTLRLLRLEFLRRFVRPQPNIKTLEQRDTSTVGKSLSRPQTDS
jgi:hypothetical protein